MSTLNCVQPADIVAVTKIKITRLYEHLHRSNPFGLCQAEIRSKQLVFQLFHCKCYRCVHMLEKVPRYITKINKKYKLLSEYLEDLIEWGDRSWPLASPFNVSCSLLDQLKHLYRNMP